MQSQCLGRAQSCKGASDGQLGNQQGSLAPPATHGHATPTLQLRALSASDESTSSAPGMQGCFDATASIRAEARLKPPHPMRSGPEEKDVDITAHPSDMAARGARPSPRSRHIRLIVDGASNQRS